MAGEIGATLVLLVGAGLLMRTVVNLVRFNPGFRTDHLLIVAVSPVLPATNAPDTTGSAEQVRTRLGALPGVQSVTWADYGALGYGCRMGIIFPGDATDHKAESVDWLSIGPHYFETLQMPLVAGRSPEERDVLKAGHWVWINRALAERYFAGRDPVGSPIRLSLGPGLLGQIAGVVGDARYGYLRREIRPTVYSPSAKEARYFLARTAVEPLPLARAVEQAVRETSPRLIAHEINDGRQQIEAQIWSERQLARVSLVLAGLALFLAVVGIYGTLSYAVARRTGEIAIRMALGAWRGEILRLIMGEGLRPVTAGIVLGALGAGWMSRLVSGFLFGVRPLDLPTHLLAALLLLVVAALACYLPAARATRVDPLVALRAE